MSNYSPRRTYVPDQGWANYFFSTGLLAKLENGVTTVKRLECSECKRNCAGAPKGTGRILFEGCTLCGAIRCSRPAHHQAPALPYRGALIPVPLDPTDGVVTFVTFLVCPSCSGDKPDSKLERLIDERFSKTNRCHVVSSANCAVTSSVMHKTTNTVMAVIAVQREPNNFKPNLRALQRASVDLQPPPYNMLQKQ